MLVITQLNTNNFRQNRKMIIEELDDLTRADLKDAYAKYFYGQHLTYEQIGVMGRAGVDDFVDATKINEAFMVGGFQLDDDNVVTITRVARIL